MRILIALDQNEYSAHTLGRVARLAENTWADIPLLGIFPGKSDSALPNEFTATMDRYQKDFLNCFDAAFSPYGPMEENNAFREVQPGIHERSPGPGKGPKDMAVRIRMGEPSGIILEEAGKIGCDLIVLGCDTRDDCTWCPGGNVPYRVAAEAGCSVLVMKKDTDARRILSCLDHEEISQASLEMISQMSTLFTADLDIVGLTKKNELKQSVQTKLGMLQSYYLSRRIQPWIELVELSDLEAFIAGENRWSLIAMWMGKQSVFRRIFFDSKVEKLISNSRSSVLLLK